jgi:hypothetical protein
MGMVVIKKNNKLGFMVEYIPNFECNETHYLNTLGQHSRNRKMVKR